MDQSKDIEKRVQDLLDRLTFKEKCMLCAGEGNNAPPAIERLGIPRFGMTDGPHGVSPYKTGVGPNGTELPESAAGTSTYFPTGIQLASTWNPALLERFGSALGEETRAVGRHMQLGPAMNICRNPMNGRTFEYFSEDPYLSGMMGAAVVFGLQKVRVSPCVKHYVANNFESNRFKVNITVSRRALEEIYLAGFKMCVKRADPWGVMSAYNKINGTYVSEHKEILRDFLKRSWGFSGVVVSDWGATRFATSMRALIEAGLDVEMGSRNRYNIDEMLAMKDAGDFPEAEFDDNIRRFLRTMFRVGIFDDPASLPAGSINTREHQAVARELASEGIILLKNDSGLLPLKKDTIKRIALLGKHADVTFGRKKLGGGSSAVFPPYEITIREGLVEKCQALGIEIVDKPRDADVAVVCIGLEHSHDFKGGDHEGSDRLRYGAGFKQSSLVKATARANPNTIVVCVNGSPFGIEPFADKVPAILEAWYGGMEIGHVVADILFGDVNPSGKLPVTWPKRKKDIPTAFNLVETIIGPKDVSYTEDIFVGYRYYDTKHVHPRFCFGHGLSYTTFKYDGLTINSAARGGQESIIVGCTIENTGPHPGAEVVQLYIKDVESSVPRPEKELKAFTKVWLEPGEAKAVEFTLNKNDLAYFRERENDWHVEPGEFMAIVGASSRDVRLSGAFTWHP